MKILTIQVTATHLHIHDSVQKFGMHLGMNVRAHILSMFWK